MEIVFSNSQEDRQVLRDGLDKHAGPYFDHERKEFGYYIHQNKEIIAGICGKIDCCNVLYVELIYVDDAHRGKDLGTVLMKKAEDFAKENQCFGLRLNTYTFQAKGFYEKLGFNVYGKVDGSKITYYSLFKKL